MLVVSTKWYPWYSNGFIAKPRHHTNIKVNVLKTNLTSETSLITADHSKLQKPTPIFNMYSKKKSMMQIIQINIENRETNIVTHHY